MKKQKLNHDGHQIKSPQPPQQQKQQQQHVTVADMPKKSAIFNKLLNVIEAKNTENLASASASNGHHSKKATANNNSNGSSTKTSSNMSPVMSHEKENLNRSVENSNGHAKVEPEMSSASTKSPMEDVRSVESMASTTTTDGTITGTFNGETKFEKLVLTLFSALKSHKNNL